MLTYLYTTELTANDQRLIRRINGSVIAGRFNDNIFATPPAGRYDVYAVNGADNMVISPVGTTSGDVDGTYYYIRGTATLAA